MNKKLDILEKSPVFEGLEPGELKKIADLMEEIHLKPGEILIREGELDQDAYILAAGSIRIACTEPVTQITHEIAVLSQGALIGEMSLIDNIQRSADAICISDCVVYCLKKQDFLALVREDDESANIPDVKTEMLLYSKIVGNIAKISVNKIRRNNHAIVSVLTEKYELTRSRLASSLLIVNTVVLISIYIIAFQLSNYYSTKISFPSEYVSETLAFIFGIGVVVILKKSDRPYSFYGITLNNWKKAISESMLVTTLLILVILLFKWILSLKVVSLPLLDISNLSQKPSVFLILAYAVFVPIQELVARGILQSMFTDILMSKYKVIMAIILSNILFAITHIHISAKLPFLVFIPGVIWGWLYSRHHTLIGVIISHLILGVWIMEL